MTRDMAGIKVLGVPQGGAAAAAGIKEGDVITKINGVNTSSIPELMEQLSRYKPGDKVTVNYLRESKELTTNAILKNLEGNTGIVKLGVMDFLGADFVPLNKELSGRLGIEGGLMVANIGSGLIKKQTNMKREFVILKAGTTAIRSSEDLKRALDGKKATRLEGFYLNDRYANIYFYDLNLSGGTSF